MVPGYLFLSAGGCSLNACSWPFVDPDKSASARRSSIRVYSSSCKFIILSAPYNYAFVITPIASARFINRNSSSSWVPCFSRTLQHQHVICRDTLCTEDREQIVSFSGGTAHAVTNDMVWIIRWPPATFTGLGFNPPGILLIHPPAVFWAQHE